MQDPPKYLGQLSFSIFLEKNLKFTGGTSEDFHTKLTLLSKYSFNQNTNLYLKTSAKKTHSNQETYSLNFGLSSIF